jgi:hypothetical protein
LNRQYNKPSELLLGALLRSGREKERNFGRKCVKRHSGLAANAYSGSVEAGRADRFGRPVCSEDEGTVCDEYKVKEQGQGRGKQGCVEARVIKEKALKYHCLSTSLPVSEDVFSTFGCSKVCTLLLQIALFVLLPDY